MRQVYSFAGNGGGMLAEVLVVWAGLGETITGMSVMPHLGHLPGLCPKCDMKLVETGTVAHGKIAEAHWVEQHPAQQH
jgi:hypothetical protein